MPGRARAPGRRAAAALLFAALLLAALLPAGATSAAEPIAPTCRGRIDARQSSASFTVEVRLPIRAEGRFTDIEGEMVPRPEGLCEVHVRVRTDTVAYAGPAWMATLTRSSAFFDAGVHPELSFHSQPFPLASLNEGGAVSGRLRLRGRERPVDFRFQSAECVSPGQACDIRVSGIVNRRDFGMQAYRFTVKDAVRFEFAIRLEPAP